MPALFCVIFLKEMHMKKLLLLCAAGLLMTSGLDAVRAKGKAKARSGWEEMKEKREKQGQEFADALAKIETSIKDVKDESTKVALDSIYAYLKMKHDMKKGWMGRKKGRKGGPRALGRGAKRGGKKQSKAKRLPAPKRKRAKYQSED